MCWCCAGAGGLLLHLLPRRLLGGMREGGLLLRTRAAEAQGSASSRDSSISEQCVV